MRVVPATMLSTTVVELRKILHILVVSFRGTQRTSRDRACSCSAAGCDVTRWGPTAGPGGWRGAARALAGGRKAAGRRYRRGHQAAPVHTVPVRVHSERSIGAALRRQRQERHLCLVVLWQRDCQMTWVHCDKRRQALPDVLLTTRAGGWAILYARHGLLQRTYLRNF